MPKFKVKINYDVGEEITLADSNSVFGSYPDTVTLTTQAPTCEIATALCVAIITTALSDNKKYCRIKDTFVQEVNEE